MDLILATQAMDDEDFVPTQKFVIEDKEQEKTLVGVLIIKDIQYPIFSGITTIGRQPSCTIVLNDETVSKRHAEIEGESTEKAIFIKDLGSVNKTKINNTKLRQNSSYQIKDDDSLTFGKITAIFKIHKLVDDSFVSCTPQVSRKVKAIIPDTPDSFMKNSFVLEDNISTNPETEADENDSCFRRPQIPVRTSISNEHESPKHVPFILDDDVPSPLNSKDDNDISGVETQKVTVDHTKEITANSIYIAETQKVAVSEKSNVHSHDNDYSEGTLNNLFVGKALSKEFENQLLEDVETQQYFLAESDSNSKKSENTSIFTARTQKVLSCIQENPSIENAETQPFISVKSDIDRNNLADASIYSAATQKNEPIVPENELTENLKTQTFTCNSLGFDKIKSANTSIYNAETQKLVTDISNQSFDDIETQKFVSNSDSSKMKSADVSIYSAVTQKIESVTESKAIEDLETQKFENTKTSLKMVSSLSFSIQDIDTMPFTKYELPLSEKSNDGELLNYDDITLNSAANTTEPNHGKEVHESNNSESKVQKLILTSFEKSDEPYAIDEINENFVQNQDQFNETVPKLISKNLLQSTSKFDESKNLVKSDDEEEIFSQNLIENCPFGLLLDDSKNDSNQQSTTNLQNDEECVIEEINDYNEHISSHKETNKNSIKNKSTVTENDDSETDEEGIFLINLPKESKKQEIRKQIESDSETDEEGIFSNHLMEEEVKKSNSKLEADSETDEEGVFSGHLSADSKEIKVNTNHRIIDESENEEDGIVSNKQSENEATNDFVGANDNIAEPAKESPFVSKSTHKDIALSPKIGSPLNKLNEIIERGSPIPESDDDIFNENCEDKRTSISDKVKDVAVDEANVDSINNSSIRDNAVSGSGKNVNDDKNDDHLLSTPILETDNLSSAPTQLISTCQASNLGEERSEEIDELAPTQLRETQHLPVSTADAASLPARKTRALTDSAKEVAKPYKDIDLEPTQKLVETQLCSEEMSTLQFSESLAPMQIVENESNDKLHEIITNPKTSSNTSKRQLKVVEVTSNKKLKTIEGLQKIDNTGLNSAVEENLNEMFEGSEEKMVDVESTIETQQLAHILESSQIEESPATVSNVSNDSPSPTLGSKRVNIRVRNRRRTLKLNKSKALNETCKSVVNLNDTIEKNLHELFDNNTDNVETYQSEPMLTQQLETVLNSSQDNNRTESKEQEDRTLNVSRKKSRLSLSMNLNNSMLKTHEEKEKCSADVQSILNKAETTLHDRLSEKSPQNEDLSVNLQQDKAIEEQTMPNNDKDIVYKRGTIGFTDDPKPVSRDSKTATKPTTSRTSSSTISRTKRIITDVEDDESTQQPSPKRTKTAANHQKLQQVTTDSTRQKTRNTRAQKILDNSDSLPKTARTDSSDKSIVENSIVEDKSESKGESKSRGKPAVRNKKKPKVDTSSEQSINSSKENLEESDVQKPKTRGKGRRNQTTDSSVSDKNSSKDEVSNSSVENRSTRSTRGRLIRQNETKNEEAKTTQKNSKTIQDSEQSKSIVKKTTRDRLTKTVNKSNSSKIDVADSEDDKNKIKKSTQSQTSSQSESVTVRTTRTMKNKVNQESDSSSSETFEVAAATRGSKRKPVKAKPELVVKLLEVDSSKNAILESVQVKDEVNVFKVMKKKMNPKPKEPTTALASKTRTRASKKGMTEESSSEESQEVSEIMKNSILEHSNPITKRRARSRKNDSSEIEQTESSDDVFEKPIARPKRARLAKSFQNLDTKEESAESSEKPTRRKNSPNPRSVPPEEAALTPSRISRLSLSPTKRPKVLFTGEKSEVHRQILIKLGGVETEDFSSCSVLITDKVRRTFKFLCSLSRGIPIASVKWLDDSKKANHFLDLEDYVLKDPEAEIKYKFNLRESLDKARKHKMLEGYTVLLAPKIKQPPLTELKEMVISSGGKPLVRAPAKWSEKSIVIATEQELDSAKKLIAKAPKSVTVQSVEFILTGILRQNINFNEFKLLG